MTRLSFDDLVTLEVDIPKERVALAAGHRADRCGVLADLGPVALQPFAVRLPALVVDDDLAAVLADEPVDPALHDRAVVDDAHRHLAADRLRFHDPLQRGGIADGGNAAAHRLHGLR